MQVAEKEEQQSTLSATKRTISDIVGHVANLSMQGSCIVAIS